MVKTVEELQTIEHAAWVVLKEHRDRDWLNNVAHKLPELRWLLPKFSDYKDKFECAESILELGGGEGWASCVVKSRFPKARVVTSDISPVAITAVDR